MNRLPTKVRLASDRNGVTSAAQVLALYPEGLLQLQGFGMMSLREVERVFLPGSRYVPRNGKQQSRRVVSICHSYPITIVKDGHVRSRR